MKKVLLLCTVLMVSVMTTACINNLAIQELNNKAESYLDKGDSETAICRLKSSLDLDNEIYQTHYNLAVAYNNIGNFDGAIEEANRVLELKPEFYDAYYILALAKEALAYNTLGDLSDGTMPPIEVIMDFNSKAQDTIDTYNKYLENVPNAVETEKINAKIAELNQKIKEYTDYYDRNASGQKVEDTSSQNEEAQ